MLKIDFFKVVGTSAVLLLVSCATFKPQTSTTAIAVEPKKNPQHTFYIAGGMGNGTQVEDSPVYHKLREELSKAGDNSTLLFTGDNVTAEENNWASDKQLLDKQISLAENFEGEVVFIPGNNEWKSYNTKKVEDIEDYIKDVERDGVRFFPENACPIERREINENLLLVLVDSKWFVSNWSRVENINKKCTDIVTRRRFMEELKDAIDDNLDKNIVIAMHHPVLSNGPYAGHKSFKDHITPFPLAGTMVNGLMDLGAFDPDHLNSRRYNFLRIVVSALAQQSDRITIVSGHEENLQYLTAKNVQQIISGSLGTKSATNLSKDQLVAIGGELPFEGVFTHGTRGFAKLEYFDDGSATVTFFSEEGPEQGRTFSVLREFDKKTTDTTFEKISADSKAARILDDPDAYNKSGFHRFLWGNRYRKYYGKEVSAPVAYLDTLYGGLKVTKVGGGHQSFSLRLEDEKGREYSMRSLRKSALKFLKFKLPGIAYNAEDYVDTWPEELVSDFFTTAHPYMQLVVDPLAKAVGVNHSDTRLFYVPKQKNLRQYNDEFGNELYFIERRPSEEQQNYKGYRRTIDESGKVTDIESTTDMLEKIKDDEEYSVDQENYIRARVFDMLIGDWDRHQDQWRWVEYEDNNGNKEFMPIPRDRDNVFPKFDGAALKLLKLFAPNTRQWHTYDEHIESPKWFNLAGNGLDRTLLTNKSVEDWVQQAEIIKERLAPAIVSKAFERLPMEVQDSTATHIQNVLLKRLEKLPEMAKEYAEYLNKSVTIRGTEKDDKIEVKRLSGGKTEVVIKRLLSDEPNTEIYRRTFDFSATEELLIYGLGDDDIFEVTGQGDAKIQVKLIGGYGDDVFAIENKNRVKVYEWKHEETDFTEKKPESILTDRYKTNTYHWRYYKPNSNILAPALGFRTDDGVFFGLKNTYTINGIHGNPFKQQHSISAKYLFAFKALELDYMGRFGNIFSGWNFEVGGYFTSNRYAKNFFGFGNETQNNEDVLDIDFYRARVEQLRASAGLAYHTLKARLVYESFKVENMPNRLFNPQNLDEALFSTQRYIGGEFSAYYKRDNAGDFPTKAIYIGVTAGYKSNLELENNKFGYASIKLGVDHKVISSGNLVFSTMAEYKSNIGNNQYFFYHAPSLGGNNGLRGYRDERFAGDSYFYQSTDLKLRLKRYITAVSPVTLGIYGGFDYGRVWVDDESSNVWHTSQGGGVWISSLKALTFKAGYFNSKENNMVQVGFGLSF